MAAISVLLPVYNCDKYLKQAIDSILNQTWQDFELIIVNDGSTDNSLTILNSYQDSRIKIVSYKDNQGVAHARNIGIGECTAEYIALMDADDIACPERLEKEYRFLKQHNDLDGVYALCQLIDRDGNLIQQQCPTAYHNYKYVRAVAILENPISNPTAMFRKKIVDEHHITYDETKKIGSDYKFWCNYLRYGKIVGINEVLCHYRIRNHSLYNNAELPQRIESERNIRLYIFEQLGFEFSHEEEEVLLNVFGVNGAITSENDMIVLYQALRNMIVQASERELDFTDEIRIMCRKKYLKKMQEAEQLWIV